MVTIRPAQAHELPTITALVHAIWPVSYAAVLTPAQIGNLLERIYNQENLQREVDAGHQFWLALENDVPVGFASAYVEGDVAWLKKIYVLPTMQGKRVGKALMEAALAPFAHARYQRLYVNCDNRAAQQFYRQQGFEVIEKVPVQMGDYHFTDFIFSRAI